MRARPTNEYIERENREPVEIPRWLATLIRKSPERPAAVRRKLEALRRGGVT